MFGWKVKEVEAPAEILDAGTLIDKPTRVNGFAYATFEYQVEVRPTGQPAVRARASGLACTACRPEPGDVLTVKYATKKGTATFSLEGDARYDPAVVSREQESVAAAKTELYIELDEKGLHGTATILAVRTGRHRFQNTAIHSDVRVRASSGDEHDATIVEWFHESFLDTIPKVGEKRPVVFDPADPSRIAWWEGADGQRWRVPPRCPQCGAPVDQSAASFADHPTCEFCNAPLPCEPV